MSNVIEQIFENEQSWDLLDSSKINSNKNKVHSNKP